MLATQEREPLAIFLDIDGVLFDNETDYGDEADAKARELFPKVVNWRERSYHMDVVHTHFFSPVALQNLDRLIDVANKFFQVQIILSSTWKYSRPLGFLKRNIFKNHNFAKYIVGKTSDTAGLETCKECKAGDIDISRDWCRSAEIQKYLQENPFKNFVILDDYDDHLSPAFCERFIQVDRAALLSLDDISRVFDLLGIMPLAVSDF